MVSDRTVCARMERARTVGGISVCQGPSVPALICMVLAEADRHGTGEKTRLQTIKDIPTWDIADACQLLEAALLHAKVIAEIIWIIEIPR